MVVHLASLRNVQHQSLIIGSPGVKVFAIESGVPDGLARVGRGDDPFCALSEEPCEGLEIQLTRNVD
jgi:hypothetical protein